MHAPSHCCLPFSLAYIDFLFRGPILILQLEEKPCLSPNIMIAKFERSNTRGGFVFFVQKIHSVYMSYLCVISIIIDLFVGLILAHGIECRLPLREFCWVRSRMRPKAMLIYYYSQRK